MPPATNAEALANWEARVANGEFDAQWPDIVDGIEKIYTKGDEEGLFIGYECLRDHWAVHKGQLVVVSGVPSHGKSTFVDNVLIEMGRRYGWKTSFFSPEHFPYHLHARKIIEAYTGMALRKRNGSFGFSVMPHAPLAEGMAFVKAHFKWVNLPEPTLPGILEIWTNHTLEHKVDAVVLDPWNEVEDQYSQNESETRYINRCLTVLRRWARTMNVLCIVVVHPTKIPRNRDGSFPVPSLSDCAGSAAWRSKADIGIICHRKDIMAGNEMDIHVQKVKFRQFGKPGIATLRFRDTHSAKLYE